MAEKKLGAALEAAKAAVEAQYQALSDREKDLLLYGCHITVKGERVDPTTVTWEAARQPENLAGKSLVQSIKEAQEVASRYNGTN